jgi:hypothetical protein
MMAIRSLIPALALALVALALATGRAPAQQKALLRYHPRVNAATHLLLWSDISTVMKELTGVASQPGRDSQVTQAAMIEGVTDRVEQAAPSFLVMRHIDSVRARNRVGAGDWTPSPRLQALSGRSVRITLNDRLGVADLKVVGGDSLPEQVRHSLSTVTSGGVAWLLPEQPVGNGDQWPVELTLPFNPPPGPTPETSQSKPVSLVAKAIMTLDSIVPRGVDTLAYLRVAGTFDSTKVEQHGDSASATATVTGRFTGTMVWSTAWNGFVSGLTKANLTMRLKLTQQGKEGGATYNVDIRNRMQVRV